MPKMFRLRFARLLSPITPRYHHFSTVAAKERSVQTIVPSVCDNIRNIAVIAHVDHGKTSLVDCLLKQSDTNLGALANEQRIMDSNELEKERGITILSKTASCLHNSCKINIVDTPGHADFGGEVERVLSMVDSVALIVDASEGAMTQTRFVLSKALRHNLKPIVIINKCDRPTARVDEVESEVLDLFLSLDASDAQLDYPTVYASAKAGWASLDSPAGGSNGMQPLLDLIVKHTPKPNVDSTGPFAMLATQLESDSFVGKCLLGRISSGVVRVGDKVKAMDESGRVVDEGRILKLFSRDGLNRKAVEEAHAGDIISIAGLPKAGVNCTIAVESVLEPIKSIPIDPPTISMTISVNDSPLQGKDGSKLTSSMIRDRLSKEVETNVAMKVSESSGKDSFEVCGRGELHLGILLENMRREGFEMCVSPPRVIFKYETDAKTNKQRILEPMEDCRIQVAQEYSGTVIQKMTKRKGELKMFNEVGDQVHMEFEIPSRGLLGYPSEFRHDTSGSGVINHAFIGYGHHKGPIDRSRKGSLISTAAGTVTAHAALSLEPRGILYIKPGDETYPGMVVGEHNKAQDCPVNPVKLKHLTNVRTVLREDLVRVTPPKTMTLEQMLAFIQDDEIIEITPKNLRIRKKQPESKR